MKKLLTFLLFTFLQSSISFADVCSPGLPDKKAELEVLQTSMQSIQSESVKELFPTMCSAIKICNEIIDQHIDCGKLYNDVITKIEERHIGTCALSEDELTAIEYYLRDGYSCLNKYLRGSIPANPEIDYLIKTLNQGLKKLPNYKGMVTRYSELPDFVRDQHVIGKSIEYSAFTSTSTHSAEKREDTFIMVSKTGKPIMGFGVPWENEVIFQSHTNFLVLDKFERDGSHVYILKEIDSKTDESISEDDVKLVKKIKNTIVGSETNKADSWFCPQNGKTIPKVIEQQKIPGLSF